MIPAIIAFAGTNIDDILVLTVLFARAKGRIRVGAGYWLGVAAVTAASVLAAGGLRMVPGEWLRALGVVPILLGLRAMRKDDDDDEVKGATLLGTALITLGNSADNLGVYTALFAQMSRMKIVMTAAVFMIMAVAWCALAAGLAKLPWLKRAIEKYGRIMTPVVFILLGLYILFL